MDEASVLTGIDVPTAADAAEISAVATTAYRATFGQLYPREVLDAFLLTWNPPAKIAAQIADPAWDVRVWRDAQGIAGFVKLGPNELPMPAGEPEGGTELHQLYFLDRAHGTGAAQALMDWAITTARAQGHPRLYLSVYVDNHRAKRFYARYGFVEIGLNPYRVGDRVDDDRVWRLTL